MQPSAAARHTDPPLGRRQNEPPMCSLSPKQIDGVPAVMVTVPIVEVIVVCGLHHDVAGASGDIEIHQGIGVEVLGPPKAIDFTRKELNTIACSNRLGGLLPDDRQRWPLKPVEAFHARSSVADRVDYT